MMSVDSLFIQVTNLNQSESKRVLTLERDVSVGGVSAGVGSVIGWEMLTCISQPVSHFYTGYLLSHC